MQLKMCAKFCIGNLKKLFFIFFRDKCLSYIITNNLAGNTVVVVYTDLSFHYDELFI